jgi:predicted phosphate transport protein (TIGR00153 family)
MKKKETDYFETFALMAQASVKAAEQLNDLICNFDLATVAEKADSIHDTEHASDNLFHDMVTQLNRAFITPIDREDILAVANTIDSITDAIEDVANLFDMLSVPDIRPGAPKMSELIVRCCKGLSEQITEFRSFKHPQKLYDLSIEVNNLEEEGDRLHRSIIKELYRSGVDVLVIIKWKEIYDMMEEVLDLCEDAADIVAGLAIKNG